MQNLRLLKKQAQKEIEKVRDLKELDGFFRKYLGKKGEVTQILSKIKILKKEKRVKAGKEANLLKNFIKQRIEMKKTHLINVSAKDPEVIDITVPGKRFPTGHLHPLTQIQRKVEEIFQSMGFSVVDGPHIETEWYNFDALNIPKDHPARDAWNTLWLKNSKLLLRTHTSPVQIRYMEKNNPPLRIIVPGRVFRREATDVSHEVNFYQIEGLMVGKNISVANFKAIIQGFFQKFFQKDVSIRMRTSYFPFTEPSFEIDMSCLNCQGKRCSVCSQSGWLEMIGAGMVHPNVLKASGLNPKNWQGFAFGMSLDRLAMMKYKINDIRLLYSGDLRFLNQF
ncbi:phenylalanine--tRNA ligase subunit alpha [Patescibacteria group bacterium]|nr:phenylalanine--tRNA ligase subunit alpha [Patescibacteria group bacterium]